MADAAAPVRAHTARLGPDPGGVLGALAFPVVVVDRDDVIRYVNAAAEQFFRHGAAHLEGQVLDRLVARDSPVFALLAQVRGAGASVSEHDVRLTLRGDRRHDLAIHAVPFGDGEGFVVLTLHERATARTIERQLLHRSAARSVSAMASMLAHEVKNPLSGIRGAAQLLEQTANQDDRGLTRLICEETDRICAMVDRMDIFADDHVPVRGAVNIHEVLERVQHIAEAGFARRVRFSNAYDPSLPPVYGNRDQLIQVFLNLVKNAAEAAPEDGGEIRLSTAFRHGIRFALSGGEGRLQLPLLISVSDNGAGVPDDIAANLFDAFVTGRIGGTGLGLALVAKIVGDHGGVVEFDTGTGGTTFRVMLPVQDDAAAEQAPP